MRIDRNVCRRTRDFALDLAPETAYSFSVKYIESFEVSILSLDEDNNNKLKIKMFVSKCKYF